MAVILEERGRGKFKPASDCKIEEVRELLNIKIEEERLAFANCSEEIAFDKLCYDKSKWNLLSLFSGCGGLDLGFELAGLKAVMGSDVMEAAFADKAIFDANLDNNVFHTIYVNDIFQEARETYAQNAGKYIYMDKSDIRKIKEFPKADIVLGGFPCPGFSEAGPRLVDDKRNFLYLHFIRCLMQILVGVRNDIDFAYVYPKPTHGYGVDGLKEVVTLQEAIGDLEEHPGEY